MKASVVFLALLVLVTGCTSTTQIQSVPPGAKVYVDEEFLGTTPYMYSDQKVVGSTIHLRLEKEGYEPLQTTIQRNEEADAGAIVAGIFLLFPFIWTMKYKPVHTYELVPVTH
jgi:hypothetical protein